MHKRFELRRTAAVPIEVITSHWDEPLFLLSSDLSPRGAYLCTDLLPNPGEDLVCSFRLKENEPEYCFFAEVTRVNLLRRESDFGLPGFGVEFVDASPADRLGIRSTLRGLPPPAPGVWRDPVIPLTKEMLVRV